MERPEAERDASVQITLMIDRGTNPVTGTVQLPGEPARGFNGSLELLTIVDELAGEPAASARHSPDV